MRIRNSVTLIFILVFFIGQVLLSRSINKPLMNISNQEASLNLSEDFVQLTNFGHGRLIAALLWVVTLIEGDIEHYNKKDSNSWMFHRFKSISINDPLFYENYLYGGQYLSIIKDDIKGASTIYEKGISHYNDDFWLNYHAGFHFYFEANDRDRALRAYEVLENNPESKKLFPALPSILAKLRSERGDLESAFRGLLSSYKQLPDSSRLKDKFHNTLYSIRAKIDLECLNSGRESCNKVDFDGIPYKKEKGSYVQNKSLSKVFLNKSKD